MGRRWGLLFLLLLAAIVPLQLARGDVRETVRETILRLRRDQPKELLLSITPAQVAKLLTDQERAVLGEQYLAFQVNVPVTVFIAMDPELRPDEFWLPERGFQETKLELSVNGERRLVWRKDCSEGKVGLGVHSMSRRGKQYFAVIVPQAPSTSVVVADIAPNGHTLGVARKGESILADNKDEVISELPSELEGHALVRGLHAREQEAHIAGFFRTTSFPSTQRPDQIVLSIGEDPSSSVSVQWRTNSSVSTGKVRYHEKVAGNGSKPKGILAKTTVVEDIGLIEDATNNRHFVTISNLSPGTTYVYSVGDGVEANWSDPGSFTTAPGGNAAFSFLYMGDIQLGYDKWIALARRALTTCPEAAFCLTAGDQANRGGERNDWDAFFNDADDVFRSIPIAPTVGNHEMYNNEPRLYLDLFHLPHNGPAKLTPERAYSFEHGGVLFLVLDANLAPEDQAPWIRERFASSKAVWKFVMFHQPMYSVAESRGDSRIRDAWGPIFDEYGVDVVFQGHDHGYLRTYPMKNGRRCDKKGQGTVYLVSNSGMKMYDTAAHDDYGARIINRTSMFQVVDVSLKPQRLAYRAFDVGGKKLDEFVLEKGN